MTKHEYRVLLEQLSLTQKEAAKSLGISIRASNGYANGMPIPEPTARLLRVLAMLGEPCPRLPMGSP
jgi:transcriptional regulator with XRE-family HTH domain